MDQPQNLLDLIKQVKPKTALFTTYTFSVSWFDAKLLPVLRKEGCREIGVLVDADQAASSAEESLSDSVGIFYRIAPVRAPGGGVFHPKLAYLVGEDDHYLAIASGNLTHSGMTFQLENLDVIRLSQEPEIFQAFALFLTTLASRVTESSPQAAQLLTDAANLVGPVALLAMTAEREAREFRPVFIDTLNVPAATTLAQAFKRRFDSARELVSLSPFHSPDGGPVLRLARAVGAQSIAVGLNAKNPIAPFDKAKYKPTLKSRFVLPKGEGLERRLHAKVLVIKGEDASLVMTGSVNATAQSMESQKNVEVSLARWSAKSPFGWTRVEPIDFAPTQNKHEFETRTQLYVDAFVDEAFFVTGVLTARQSLPATLLVRVLHGSEVVLEQSLILADNSFLAGPLVDPTVGGQALRLVVEAGALTGSTWLNVVTSLEKRHGEHKRQGMMARVARGEASAEDWDTIIGLLQEDLLDRPSQPKQEPDAKTDELSAFNFPKRKKTHSRAKGSSSNRIDEDLAALNRMLHSPAEPEPKKDALKPRVTFVRKTDRQLAKEAAAAPSSSRRNNPNAEKERQSARLERLCEDFANKLALDAHGPSAYTMAQIAASRALHRSRNGLDGGDFKTVVVWLSRFTRFNYSDPVRQQLLPLAVALSCASAAGNRDSAEVERKSYPVLSALKQHVEQLANKPLGLDEWQTHAQAGLALMLFDGTSRAQKVAALASASVLAETQDIDVAVVGQLKRALAGETLEEGARLMFPGIQKTVEKNRMKLPLLLKGLATEADVDGGGCPLCSMHFRPEERRELRLYRTLSHDCGKLVLYPANKARMSQMLKELDNV